MNIQDLNLVPVEKANSKASVKTGPKGPKNEPFDLRRSTTKTGERFTFTRKSFETLQIGPNSAKQFNTADSVVVAVMPGNTGVFLKNTAKGGKGRAFKNDELAKALDERSISARAFAFEFIGEEAGARYYKLQPVVRTPKAAKAVAAPTTEAVAQ